MLREALSLFTQGSRSEARYSVRPIDTALDRAEWDCLARKHSGARSIYPTYFTAAGWIDLRLGLFERDRLIGGAHLARRRVRNLPFETSKLLALMLPEVDRERAVDVLLFAIERLARKHFLFETEVQLRLPSSLPELGAEEVAHALERHGYKRLARSERSYFVRIDRDDAALLASFGQQPRNRIKKSIRDGATVVELRGDEALELLWRAYSGTVERKNIATMLPRSVIVGGLAPLLEDGRALLLAEKLGERISNMLLVDPRGVPCAMIAARSDAHVAGELSGCAQRVHFEAMRAMRALGHRWYDFGGCEGPIPIESHPNYGVWRMKHAFKGDYVTFMPFYRRIRAELDPLVTRLHRHRGDPIEV
jgi:hypothetical protein